MNIRNFTNRQLCEYQSIFPTVASLLEHLLFVIGNGYTLNPATGMIMGESGVAISDYPTMTPEEWATLIQDCHNKEREYKVRFGNGRAINEEQLALDCAAYKVVSVDDSAFSEQALYEDLQNKQTERRVESHYWLEEVYLRPYPLSEKYSDIFNLNENTPVWFLQIALNLCNAWIRFLSEAIETNDVWVPHEPGNGPQTDYADINFTTTHRNMLVDVAHKIEGFISNAAV